MSEWTLEKDAALVMYVNEICSQLAISSARLHPHEVQLTEAHLTNEKYSCLQGLCLLVSLHQSLCLLVSLHQCLCLRALSYDNR